MHRISKAPLQPEPNDIDPIEQWLSNPDPSATIALCNWLAGHGGTTPRLGSVGRKAIVEVGREAARRYPSRVGVLLAVGRMLLVAGELELALESLVVAAKLAPREPILFRLLGEVALRRGDAKRALRMLERAMSEGMTDSETVAWHQHARLCAIRQTPGNDAAPAEPDQEPAVRAPTPAPRHVRRSSGMRLTAAAGWIGARAVATRSGRD